MREREREAERERERERERKEGREQLTLPGLGVSTTTALYQRPSWENGATHSCPSEHSVRGSRVWGTSKLGRERGRRGGRRDRGGSRERREVKGGGRGTN